MPRLRLIASALTIVPVPSLLMSCTSAKEEDVPVPAQESSLLAAGAGTSVADSVFNAVTPLVSEPLYRMRSGRTGGV
jgi:hypothetical protein